MVSAIEQGYVQREVQASAYRYQLDIEDKKRVIVGQNEFVSEAAEVEVTKIDASIEHDQKARVKAWRAKHDGPAKSAALAAIDAAAKGSENLVPRILEAVKAGATVGEVSDVLRIVWGEHKETLTI
jgi:methylmalonyl-CoA mutase N-terminal domain/subunit